MFCPHFHLFENIHQPLNKILIAVILINIMYNSNSIRSRTRSQRGNSGSCTQQHFYLTQRGVRQSQRNNSNQIWKIFGNDPYGYIECQQQQYNKKGLDNTLDTSGIGASTEKTSFKIDRGEKGILKAQQNKQQNQKSIQNRSKAKSVSFNLDQESGTRKRENSENGKNENKSKSKSKKKLKPQEQQMQRLKREKYLKQCYSINEFLKSNKAYTREMPNSTIKLMYELPCLQAYGRSNISGNNGFIYNDFMKTHNVLPHRLGNQPVKYQAYRSALNFCKRTKIDPEERWKKIHRQMRSKLNMKELVQYFSKGTIDVNDMNLESVLKLDINTLKGSQFKRSRSLTDIQRIPNSSHQVFNTDTLNSTKANKLDLNRTKATDDTKESDRISELKRSKSWGKKQYLFLYKYTNKQGQNHYCKDRHGITCYVDPSFEQNEQAYKKFLRRIKPIEAEEVKEQDRNIDKLLVRNFIQSKQQDLRKHYLLPNCQQPVAYKPEKYSIRARKQIQSSNVE